MKKVRIPGTDLEPSQLCLGTNMFGSAAPAARAEAILAEFLAQGGNFLDTAHSYGDWPAKRGREGLVIATKGCEFDYRAGDYALRVTPRHLEEDLRGSLECLR